MRESIIPMRPDKQGRSRHDPRPSPSVYTAHRCDEFQPGNPQRVALQQSSLPLPRPHSGSTINSRSPTKSQRTAHRDFALCLTQGGHPILSTPKNEQIGTRTNKPKVFCQQNSWRNSLGQTHIIEVVDKARRAASHPAGEELSGPLYLTR